jgi:dihydrolipoamide dehydrogenase
LIKIQFKSNRKHNMNTTYNIDVAVIGAGTAGLAAYRQSIAQGATTLIIEGGPYARASAACLPNS